MIKVVFRSKVKVKLHNWAVVKVRVKIKIRGQIKVLVYTEKGQIHKVNDNDHNKVVVIIQGKVKDVTLKLLAAPIRKLIIICNQAKVKVEK